MAAVSLCPTAGAFYQGFTVGGVPLNAGLIYTYAAGGTTPTATYTTSAGNVTNANPIVLGADGRPPNEIWLVNGTAYRFDVKDSAGNLIATYDNVSGIQAAAAGSFLPLAGGTMTGNIAMSGTQKLTGLAAGSAAGDSVRYEQSPAGILSGKGYLITATAANTPAALAVGSNGQDLVANSNATNGVQWGYPALRSYLAGCTLSTAGSSATMSIAAGTAVDSTNVSAMVLAATSKTTSSWAAGAAQGGLDTGSISTSTWYHWFVIQRVDTGATDVLFSLSSSSPTMPANYTLFRRIGSGKTDGSSNWTAFVQYGDTFEWLANVQNASTTNPGTSAVLTTLTVPTGVKVRAWISSNMNNQTSSDINILFTDPAQTDSAASSTQMSYQSGPNAASAGGGAEFYVGTDTSGRIRYRLSVSGAADTIVINTRGWIDRRGRDD